MANRVSPPGGLAAWVGFDGLPNSGLALHDADEVITVRALCDVIPALRRVEKAVRHGSTAIGLLSYESAPAFDPAMAVHASDSMGDFPLLHFALVNGNSTGRASKESWEEASSSHRRVAHARDGPSVPKLNANEDPEAPKSRGFSVSEWVPDVSREHYNQCIGSVKEAIREGISYQVNYTLRLSASIQGDTRGLLSNLLRAQRCGYGAYIHTGTHEVLSASPELFFTWREADRVITTRPMKGTAPRGLSAEEDEGSRAALRACVKNRAENLMIVDLLRNDVGRVAVSGSVAAPSLFDVEAYPTVLQMTSTVTAVTKPSVGLVELLTALFPCGSITGAPKLSTMRVIAGLEGSPRGVYCGAILAITPEHRPTPPAGQGGGNSGAFSLCVTASVPIRTVVADARTGAAQYGVGGGVTWDSTAGGEYEEVLDKARVLRVASRQGQGLQAAQLQSVIATPSDIASSITSNASDPDVTASAASAPCSLGEAMRGGDFSLLETLRLEYRPQGCDVSGGPFNRSTTPHPPLERCADCKDAASSPSESHHYFVLDRHLGRLAASARYFGYRCDPQAVRAALQAHALKHAPVRSPRSSTEALVDDAFDAAPVMPAPQGQSQFVHTDEALRPSSVCRRVRLLLTRSGEVTVESTPLPAGSEFAGAQLPSAAAAAMARLLPEWEMQPGNVPRSIPAAGASPQRCLVSPLPVSRRNVFLYHKTTQRGAYEAQRAIAERAVKAAAVASGGSPTDWLDVLLWSEAGGNASSGGGGGPSPSHVARDELSDDARAACEFTIGNLVVEDDGDEGCVPRLLTPPVSSGCLPGALRAEMVRAGAVSEAVLSLDRLRALTRSGARMWLLNSVRGWVPVTLDFELL